jgi:hypothetical protein
MVSELAYHSTQSARLMAANAQLRGDAADLRRQVSIAHRTGGVGRRAGTAACRGVCGRAGTGTVHGAGYLAQHAANQGHARQLRPLVCMLLLPSHKALLHAWAPQWRP